MQKWEYLFVNLGLAKGAWKPILGEGDEWKEGVDRDEYVNSLGDQGWELVSHEPVVQSESFKVGLEMKSLNQLRTIRLVFKRPKE